MSLPAMTFGDRFCFSMKGQDRGRWIDAPKGCRQHGCLWALLWKTPWLALSGPLLSSYALRKTVLSPCMAPISGGEAVIPVWASVCQPSAMTIGSSLMGRCGLSHEHVEDGCKNTCVKFGG